MSQKEILVDFFKEVFLRPQITDSELKAIFNSITGYRYVTPTAVTHFKNVLLDGGFLIKQNKLVHSLDWDKILGDFKPELATLVKKHKKQQKGKQ